MAGSDTSQDGSTKQPAVWEQSFPWASSTQTTAPPRADGTGEAVRASRPGKASVPAKESGAVTAAVPEKVHGPENVSAPETAPARAEAGLSKKPPLKPTEEAVAVGSPARSRFRRRPAEAVTTLASERIPHAEPEAPARSLPETNAAETFRRRRGNLRPRRTAKVANTDAARELTAVPDSGSGSGSAPVSVASRAAASRAAAVHEPDSPRRPGRHMAVQAAGFAVAGSLLLVAPFALLAGDHDKPPKEKESAQAESRSVDAAPRAGAELPGLTGDAEPTPTSPPGRGRGSASPHERPTSRELAPAGHVDRSGHPLPEHTHKPAASSGTPRSTPAPKPPSSAPGHPAPSASTPAGGWSTTVVRREQQLAPGQSWSTNRITMTMRTDGALVLYDEHRTLRWSTGTSGSGNRAIMQGDGNLVVYDRDNRPLWTSGTAGHENAILCLQADGNVTILWQNQALWSTNTHDR